MLPAVITWPKRTAGGEGPAAIRRALLPAPGPARDMTKPVASCPIENRSLCAACHARVPTPSPAQAHAPMSVTAPTSHTTFRGWLGLEEGEPPTTTPVKKRVGDQ